MVGRPVADLRLLTLYAEGLIPADIGKAVGCSADVVRHRLARLARTLGARNTVHAVSIAYRDGLLPLAPDEPRSEERGGTDAAEV